MSQKTDSILIGANSSNINGEDDEMLITSGGKWEDEEEKRFYEDIQDLKDFVPKSVLGIDENEINQVEPEQTQVEENERIEKEKAQEEVRKLEEELEGLKLAENMNVYANGEVLVPNGDDEKGDEDDQCVLKTLSVYVHAKFLLGSQRPRQVLPSRGLRPCRRSSHLKGLHSFLHRFLSVCQTRRTARWWTKLPLISHSSIQRLREKG